MKPFDIESNEKIETGFKIPANYFEQLSRKNIKSCIKNRLQISASYAIRV